MAQRYRDTIGNLRKSLLWVAAGKDIYWRYIDVFVVWPVTQGAKENAITAIEELVKDILLVCGRDDLKAISGAIKLENDKERLYIGY